MIAIDTNVLVYAHLEELPQHKEARARLNSLAEGQALWAIPVFCLTEFLRVVTHPRIFQPPYSPDEACNAIQRVLESPSLRVLTPGDRFPGLLCEAITQARASGNLVFDAQIVAVCREAGVSVFLTADGDFARFTNFRVERF